MSHLISRRSIYSHPILYIHKSVVKVMHSPAYIDWPRNACLVLVYETIVSIQTIEFGLLAEEKWMTLMSSSRQSGLIDWLVEYTGRCVLPPTNQTLVNLSLGFRHWTSCVQGRESCMSVGDDWVNTHTHTHYYSKIRFFVRFAWVSPQINQPAALVSRMFASHQNGPLSLWLKN